MCMVYVWPPSWLGGQHSYVEEVKGLFKKESQEKDQALEENVEEEHNKDDYIIPNLEEHEADLVKEIHDEDQALESLVEETIEQDLVNKVLGLMSKEEGTPKDEDDEAQKHEDEEGLIEGIEDHKKMVSSPYFHFKNSYNIVGLLKENGRIL